MAGRVPQCVAVFQSAVGVEGTIAFTQEEEEKALIIGKIVGLKAGKHTCHIHRLGDTTLGLASAGESKQILHEFEADEHGKAEFTLPDFKLSLEQVVGRAVMVHDDPTKDHNDASNYLAVGVISRAGSCLIVPDKK